MDLTAEMSTKIIRWEMMMSSYEKCGYYSDGECSICGMGMSGEDTFCRLCKDNPNCYYKQLSELKAENERLKEKIESYVCSQNCYAYKHADKYRHILQEIKEYINSQGIDNSWNMRIQRFRMGILDLITKAESEEE